MKCKMWYCNRSSQRSKDVQFFRFPKNRAIRAEWVRRCVQREADIPLFDLKDSSRVCSDHFPDGKKNDDKSVNLPVPTPPFEVDEPLVKEGAAIEHKIEVNEIVVKNLPINQGNRNEYCRVCLRIVSTLILQKLSRRLGRKIRAVFKINLPVNSTGFVCTNCVNLMDISVIFHRAVQKAHKLQSQLNQKFRLECNEFWNHSEHVQYISRCKDIVKHHSKAIDALCKTDLVESAEPEVSLPETSNVKVENNDTDVLDSDVPQEIEFIQTKEEIIEETIIEETIVEPSALKRDSNVSSSDEDATWNLNDDNYYNYQPPVFLKKRIPPKERRRDLLPSEHKIAYFKRHRLPVPVYRAALCDICGKHSNRNQAEAHRNRHLGVKPYTCDVEGCTSTFYGRSNLFIHKRRFHFKPTIRDCHVCGKPVRGDDWSYNGHVRTHSKQRERFECIYCGKCYSEEHRLKRHVRYTHGTEYYKEKPENVTGDSEMHGE